MTPARHRARNLLLAEVRESFAMALGSIAAHKLRSGLTLLGIGVGVFSIVVVMTALRVLQSNIETNLNLLGANSFAVQRFPAVRVDDGPSAEKYFRRQKLTYETTLRLRERALLPTAVGVILGGERGEATSVNGKTNPNIELLGVSPETFPTRNWVVEQGRALIAADVDSRRDVAVLGASLAKKLFPRGGALGERVKFGGFHYQVVGVLEAKGSLFGQDQDSFLAIPVTTKLDRYGRERDLPILVQARDQAAMNETIEEVRSILRKLRKVPPGEDDDFEIASNDSIINQFRALTLAVRAGAGVISSIALLAAGVGIMNIMLVSVTERTREIGIRRAIGAKKRTIMTQFVMEAIALCQIGGVAGVALGILAGNLAALVFQVPPVIPWDWAAIGLLVCSFVGVAFGAFPAWKAAQLDPIESLRYE
ncbi:MAG: ABC transporter permease [Limisphaerales bacterium]